jgi:hypothetical protein
LKKKLKKYEQIYCGQLQSDKLFEIRVHALPASKKRKLERTLQDFASSLGDTADEELSSAFAQKLAKVPDRKALHPHNASSSSGSNSRPVDSAYASMSTSGGNSTSRLQKQDSGQSSVPSINNEQSIKSYLSNISWGLLPKHPPVMTEKAKKALVVRRLEQLFTGSRDISGKHSQSKQQQEVSQSAANADRKESEAQGHRVEAEGRRESKIYASEQQIPQTGLGSGTDSSEDSSPRDRSASGATPDQRPTRPLDLDPSRAQDPLDNIGYIKHLGFDSPLMDAEKNVGEEEGWIFLNLLIGMAQLHILNVTPDFVRNAIREQSHRFELSSDGARIRWKGGKEPTLVTMESGETSEHSSAYSYELGVPQTGHSKSSKRSTENQSGVSGNNQSSHNPSSGSYNTMYEKQRPMLLGQTNYEDPYQYRPLFYHNIRSEEEDSYSYDGKDSSLSSGPVDSSMLDPDGARHRQSSKKITQSRLRKGADPIIFYNKAKFYTDLSKDDESMPYNCPLYTKDVDGIVGWDDSSSIASAHEDKGPISKEIAKASQQHDAENSDNSVSLDGFTDESTTSSKPTKQALDIKSFEASGIGGVVPGDNFSIEVNVQHQYTLHKGKSKSKIVSVQTKELPPSDLPPPSYAFLPFSSSSSDYQDSDSEESEEELDPQAYEQNVKDYVPPRFLNSFSSEEATDSADDDDSDDSSIDMLAQAREIEPETVAAAEKEFDDNASSNNREMDVDPPASSIVALADDQSTMADESANKETPGAGPSSYKRGQDGGRGRGKAKQRRIRA